jgi:hypothetical protein
MPAAPEPMAIPTLDAELPSAEASVGAEPAKRMTSAPSTGAAAKPVTPMTVTSTTAATGLVERNTSKNRTSALAAAAMMSVASGRRSPIRPPTVVPSRAPRP